MAGCEGCELSDNYADAAALTEAMLRGDAVACEVLLTHGCAAGISLMLAGWLAVALRGLDAETVAVIVGGWRQRAGELRASCPPAGAGG